MQSLVCIYIKHVFGTKDMVTKCLKIFNISIGKCLFSLALAKFISMELRNLLRIYTQMLNAELKNTIVYNQNKTKSAR